MSDAAAIKATFTDYKRIKSRKVMQIVFEVPLETWSRDYSVLGEPEIETSQWFAIARMDGAKEPAPTPEKQGSNLAANAALTLREGSFQRFAWQLQPIEYRPASPSLEIAESYVKGRLGIKSKSELNTDPRAAAMWRELRADYEAWLRT